MDSLVKACTLMLAVFVCGTWARGQEGHQVVPMSPEAAALTKMVNYPINHNTGIPDIRIPFYEISVGGLRLPIELVYHAGGFRINEQATRAGLGWSLTSDIQISRTVNGLSDFEPTRGYLANTLARTHYPNAISCPSCPYPLWESTPFPYANAYDVAMGEKDAMPDRFDYKLLGKSGSFYFRKNEAGTGYAIVPVPFDNIKIQYDNGRFIITDTDGTVYYFGESGPPTGLDNRYLEGKEYTGKIDGGCIDCLPTTWKCKKIVNATGTDELIFSYANKPTSVFRNYRDVVEVYDNEHLCSMGWLYRSDEYPLNLYTAYDPSVPFQFITSPRYWVRFGGYDEAYLHIPYVDGGGFVDRVYSNYEPGSGNTRSDVAGVSLSEISFRGGKVVFSGAGKLEYIRVLDSKNAEVKSLHFFQSYETVALYGHYALLNGPNFLGTAYLDSLHLRNGGTTYERYAMLYKDRFCFGNHLKGHDAWGYSNASTIGLPTANDMPGNYMTLPAKELVQGKYYFSASCGNFIAGLPFTIGGDQWAESPDEAKMQRGILRRIVYPTGGFTEFDFEANRYTEDFHDGTRSVRVPQLGGGLRIRSISHYDAENSHVVDYRPTSQSYYRYGDLEDGTGILINRPRRARGPGLTYFDAVSFEQEIVYLYEANPNPWNPPCLDRSCFGIQTIDTKTTYKPSSSMNYTYANGAPIYYTKVSEYQSDLGTQTERTVYEYYPPEEFSWLAGVSPEFEIHYQGLEVPILRADGFMGALKSVTTYKAATPFSYEPVHRKTYEYTHYVSPQWVQAAYAVFRVLYQVLAPGVYQGEHRDLYDNSKPLIPASSGQSPGAEFYGNVYGIAVGRLLPSKEEETFYGPHGVHSTARYHSYANLPYLGPSKTVTYDSKGKSMTQTFHYPFNFTGVPAYAQLVSANRIGDPVEEVLSYTVSGAEVSRRRTDYESFSIGGGFVAPSAVRASVQGQPLEVEQTFDSYDQYANLQQASGRDGVPTTYLWGYSGLYPVAELRGVSYASVPSAYKGHAQLADPSSDATLRSLLSGLHGYFAGTHAVGTYTYKRLVGMSSATAAGGRDTFYEYDGVGRLVLERNHAGHAVQRYQYGMKGPSWANLLLAHHTNVPVLLTHYRLCPGGVVQPYNYLASGGTYIGPDQEAADFMAWQAARAGTLPPGLPACPPSAELAYVQLGSIFMEDLTEPSWVDIDFIRDGSVVASQSIKPHEPGDMPDYGSVYLPAGEYQISMRPKAGLRYHNDGLLYYHFDALDDPGPAVTFHSGHAFVLEQGKSYLVMVGNL